VKPRDLRTPRQSSTLPFVESTPRAYRLKASNAAPSISTFAGAIPLFLGSIGLLSGISARAQERPPGDASEGKRLFIADGCFLCHGRAGEGGALNGPAPILSKTQLPFEGFVGELRQPIQDMPAYSEQVMSEQQIADIYAFVQSLPGPRPVKDVLILNDY
jgi:mono/diheme cytochrome c family protein